MAADADLIETLREQLVRYSHRAHAQGLVAGVSGNNSVRIPGSELALIKATGCSQAEMSVADTVLMSIGGEVLDRDRRPSKEWQFHMAIYRIRPEVGAVVHQHPPTAVALTYTDRIPQLVTAAARGHLRRLGSVPLLPAGSLELAEAVAAQFADPEVRGVLMREHGAITIGPDLATAHDRTEYLEENCKVAVLAAGVTGAPADDLPLQHDADPGAEGA